MSQETEQERTLYYPKIAGSRQCTLKRCFAFEKYDGTNLHWDWEREFSWHSFGTRRDSFMLSQSGIAQFSTSHPELAECAPIFEQTLGPSLASIFLQNPRYQNIQEIKVFTEFLGSHSFAGRHQKEDPKRLVLFDVWVTPFGFISPAQFVEDFHSLPIARLVYQGKFTGQFAEDVRNGKYQVAEGVVCKEGEGQNISMVKIKTYTYMKRLQQAFAENWEEYWE